MLWSVFERVRAGLQSRRLITYAALFSSLAAAISKNKNMVFDFAVVDEAQDLSPAHLRFFAALGGSRPNALFFAGDLGQRIFQQPFSWKALGVDIRGRSRALRVNYRTSHQIRTQADCLLGPVVTDVDGNSEDRSDTVSVFNGPPPTIHSLESEKGETKTVSNWIAELTKACRTSLASSSGLRRNWIVPEPPRRRRECRSRFSMNMSKPLAATSQSAPCTSPKGWSSGPWP